MSGNFTKPSHRLIRPPDVYADLFARIAAGQCAESSTVTEEPPQP